MYTKISFFLSIHPSIHQTMCLSYTLDHVEQRAHILGLNIGSNIL